MYFPYPNKSYPKLQGFGAYHVAQSATPVATAGLGQTTFVNPSYLENTPFPYIKGPNYTRPVFREHGRGGNFVVQPMIRMQALRGFSGEEGEPDREESGFFAEGRRIGCEKAKAGLDTSPYDAMAEEYGSLKAAAMFASGLSLVFIQGYKAGYEECKAGATVPGTVPGSVPGTVPVPGTDPGTPGTVVMGTPPSFLSSLTQTFAGIPVYAFLAAGIVVGALLYNKLKEPSYYEY